MIWFITSFKDPDRILDTSRQWRVKFLPCVNVEDRAVNDLCGGETPAAAASAGIHRSQLIQLHTDRRSASEPVWGEAAGHAGMVCHLASLFINPPNCSGRAERKPFPSVCFPVSVWRRLEGKDERRGGGAFQTERAERDVFYHRDVALIWLLFLCVCFSAAFCA